MAEKIKLGTNGNFGVKEGGTLAYNDENGVFKAIELASSRASGATYVAQSGLIADAKVGVPRIDWTNGVGELLLEPQSTNLLPYSEDFSVSDWTKTDITTSVGDATSPLGKSTLITQGVAGTARLQDANNAVVANTDCAVSAFLKKGNADWLLFQYTTSTSTSDFARIWVNLSTGLIGTTSQGGTGVLTSSSITDFGNGWYRVVVVGKSNQTLGGLDVIAVDADNSGTRLNNGTYNIVGCQLEQLSYPTSYIRTEGSAVTRIADAVTGNSSLGQVINSSEGVLYVEMSALADSGTFRQISINDATTNNLVQIDYSTTSNQIRGVVLSGGSVSALMTSVSADVKLVSKIAIKYKENDFALWINGVEVATDVSGVIPIGLDKLSFDNGVGGNPFYGRIRDLRVYDTALDDATLTTLTTI